MSAVYVVRSHVGRELELDGRVVKPWGLVEVPVERATPEWRAAVKAAKDARLLQVALVVGGAPVDERNEAAALGAVERAPPAAEPPAPTGAKNVGME